MSQITYSNIFTMAEQYASTRSQMLETLLQSLSDFSTE